MDSRHFLTRSLSSMFRLAIWFMPRMTFNGVRISWDMQDRKRLFAALALLAASQASLKACRSRASCFFCWWIFWVARITLEGMPFLVSIGMNCNRSHWYSLS